MFKVVELKQRCTRYKLKKVITVSQSFDIRPFFELCPVSDGSWSLLFMFWACKPVFVCRLLSLCLIRVPLTTRYSIRPVPLVSGCGLMLCLADKVFVFCHSENQNDARSKTTTLGRGMIIWTPNPTSRMDPYDFDPRLSYLLPCRLMPLL